MPALTPTQEEVLTTVTLLFGTGTFSLDQCVVPCIRPYQIREALDAMAVFGLVRKFPAAKTTWELEAQGFALGKLLNFVIERKVEIKEAEAKEAIDNPKPFRKLEKKEKWEMDLHFAIPTLVAEIQEGKWAHSAVDEGDEFYATCLYTDGTQWVMSLGVTFAELLKGSWDPRFTHVLVVYPNVEDK